MVRLAGDVRHFASPYYVVGLLTLLSYIPVRLHWSRQGLSKYARLRSLAEVSSWEYQCFGMIGIIFCMKSVRERLTLDVVLGDVLLYCKGVILTITFMADPRICVYFSVVFLLAYLLAPQPYRDYSGPNNTRLLTLKTFNEDIRSTASRQKWLVLFFMPGKVGRQLNQVFASLSLSHADHDLAFARVNAQAEPDVASSVDITLEMSSSGAALVMFQNGQETRRLSRQDHQDLNASDIIKEFDLDKSVYETAPFKLTKR